MIFDTDVLIWYFRGNLKAKKALQTTKNMAISAVTLMELIQGVRNKQELIFLNKFFHSHQIGIYYINEEINLHAIHILEEHSLAHGTEWGDALIAATAFYHSEEIFTANIKHYRHFTNINIKKFTAA